MLTTSVAVVRKMADAVAGSRPKRFSVRGIIAPDRPLAMHEVTIARKTTKASSSGWVCCWPTAVTYMPAAAKRPTPTPFRSPRPVSLLTSLRSAPGFSSPSVMPRSVTASAWQPVLPDCPASTGRKSARITSRSSVSWNAPTTAAARNAVSRLSCSHGWRILRLRGNEVARRSSFSTPTMVPGCADRSIARASNMVWPRTRPRRRPEASSTG